MRQALEWIKSMPMTVISLGVIVVSLGFLGWVWSQGSEFREEMEAQESQLRTIDQMMNQSIPLPASDPGGEPVMLQGITINRHAIETLTDLFHRMQGEYEQIRTLANEHNRAGREPLIEGIFPEPEGPQHPYQARDRYREVFPRLLRTPEQAQQARQGNGSNAGIPYLVVGLPPDRSRLQNELNQFSQDYRESIRPTDRGDRRQQSSELTVQEVQALNEEKRNRLKDVLYRRAQEIHVYAQPDPDSSEFPLDFHDLRRASRPQLYQIWEAQLELWIQQDIIRAIRRANELDEPGANVLTGSFKRLISLEVLPGYVGLHSRGGVVSTDRPSEPYRQPEDYSEPPAGEVPRNFLVSPTGHMSNPIYDVRHVRLVGIVDYQRLPEIYNAIHGVNFMTVLQTQVRDIDKYEHYREGFVYGEGVDAVRVEMIIDSLWLRDWTEEFMPDRVKSSLGILPPVDDGRDSTDPYFDDYGGYDDPFGDGGGGDGGGGPGGF